MHPFFQAVLHFPRWVEDVSEDLETFSNRKLRGPFLVLTIDHYVSLFSSIQVLVRHKLAGFWFLVPVLCLLDQIFHHLFQVR